MDKRSEDKKQLRHEDYTVGWLAAILPEQNAAKVMLDEEHKQLPTDGDDDNTYILGRVGVHNVVIARPAIYGTNSAAYTAVNMVKSFRSLRFVLMVGIGGGAPGPPVPEDSLEEDIRLGDVVVGFPKGSHSGVLQYDMGKLESQFTIRSHLNKPPKVLLTAVGVLQTQHDFEEGEMIQYLNTALQHISAKKTKKLKTCRFPGRNKDLLFKADYHHRGNTKDCSACDSNQIEKRIDREMDDPVVHYGLIASGNTLMKSAQKRNKLRDGEQVVCFEMEAAGLMDNFPCLVIRGICDYSDDHKNDLWQPYAALAAGAYAKDLLRVVQPKEVEHTKAIADVLEGLCDIVYQIKRTTERIESTQQDKQCDETLRWLSPLEPGKRHQDVRCMATPGTGEWFLKEPTFQTWFDSANTNHVLCCSGIPGAGKTVIASHVIESLAKRSMDPGQEFGFAYIYCDYRDQAAQTPINLIGSLLGQLLSKSPSLPKEVIQLHHQKSREYKTLEQGDIEPILLHICQKFNRVYICIDAIDECQFQEDFLKSLRRLLPSIKLFITGRPHIPSIINQYFADMLKIIIEANEDDVKKFVTTKIDEDWTRDKYLMDEKLKQEILGKIGAASQKMFLLPALQIRMVLDERTKTKRRTALVKLPTKLYEAFGNIVERIRQQSQSSSALAMDILMWAHLAERPLRISEFLDALAVKLGDKNLDIDNFPSRQSWLDCCLGLVITDEETSTVRLVHFSLQEYLHSQRGDLFKKGHERIAKTCLTYLCFDNITTSPILDKEDLDELAKKYSFLGYAASQWGHHIRKEANLSIEVVNLSVSYLLQPQLKIRRDIAFDSELKLYEIWRHRSRFLETFSDLHNAIYFGRLEGFRFLVKTARVDIDSRDIYREWTLNWAAGKGYLEIVKLLVETGRVDIDSRDDYNKTPLSCAAESGYLGTVKFLVETGRVDINSRDDYNKTPLSWAAENGHFKIVKFLVETGRVDINSRDNSGQTPLFWAAWGGHLRIVKFLVETGRVDIDSRDSCDQTPLSWAAKNGHFKIVKFLVETGRADVDSMDNSGQTPLSWAKMNWHFEIVAFLNNVGSSTTSTNQ
ncbi:hypothetical protein TWF694_001347 [Orbilia ellipsospora]|uniref:Nucleoside phosphorylase domain-containing protein n=1 Tax=Orbilia ellipsospora TaxID=2528407 RepID=A0AAV9XRE8_9PEZI